MPRDPVIAGEDRHDRAQNSRRSTRRSGEPSGNLSNTPFHTADLATDTFEQEVSVSLLENKRQIEGEVAGALDRLDQGTYGQCEGCGKQINKDRLQALPYTRYCVACARVAEKNGEDGQRPTTL